MTGVEFKIKMQLPSDGCDSCGAPVKTYKGSSYGWLCYKCHKSARKQAGE